MHPVLLGVNKKPFVLSRASGALGLAGKKHQKSRRSLQIHKVLWSDVCCSCAIQVNHTAFGNSFGCRNEQRKGHWRYGF